MMNIKCEQTWLKYAFDLDVDFFVEPTSKARDVIFLDLLLPYPKYNECSRCMNVTLVTSWSKKFASHFEEKYYWCS